MKKQDTKIRKSDQPRLIEDRMMILTTYAPKAKICVEIVYDVIPQYYVTY